MPSTTEVFALGSAEVAVLEREGKGVRNVGPLGTITTST